VTSVGRAAERANRRRQRRHSIKVGLAGFLLACGVILAVVLEFRTSDHRAASLSPSSSPSAAAHSSAGAPPQPSAASIASIPVSGSGSLADPGPAAYDSPGAAAAVLAAATAGVEAVDSYDYRDINRAIQAGLTATTGEFQTSYRAAMTGVVASQAPAQHTVQLCTVRKLGLSTLSTDQSAATVLVLGRLQTQDLTTGTTPRETAITLGVTLANVNGQWLISAVADLSTGTQQSVPPGTGALQAATRAGAQEVLNLLSFSRANYVTDFGRALSGLTGPLLTEQESQRASILATMTSAGADYVGQVRAVGIESVSADSLTLLVVASSFQVDATGKQTPQTQPEIEVGVVRVNGQWLVDQFLAVSSG
jgi:hypothetical protein